MKNLFTFASNHQEIILLASVITFLVLGAAGIGFSARGFGQ